ncbi:MAG TPA: S-layer homology domain-containing protein [Thermoanaerobaculia bacterium]|nr:S-layer homology domain-containing protein [Thermoanaerobaculia bacterium]
MKLSVAARRFLAVVVLSLSTLAGAGTSFLLGTCGPFTDVAADVFCPFVLEIFYLGITTGTTATTYDPTANVSRLQMAAFLSRTVDGVLRRGSRRAALDQFWTTKNATVLGLTTVGSAPALIASDGVDIWVADHNSSTVSRVRASDGRLLETWTGASFPTGVLSAMGRIFIAGNFLGRIDPGQPAGAVENVTNLPGGSGQQLTFDGSRIWVANSTNGSVSIVTPGATTPWTVTTVTAGFSLPVGAVFDGSSIWVTDNGAGTLLNLSAAGAILQTVTVGPGPGFPVFDGANIWVPNFSDSSVSVVRASSGAVLATLTGNSLGDAHSAAFDGQRVLVTGEGGLLSLWKAADLTPLGGASIGLLTSVIGACSDGVSFWITLNNTNLIARF